MKRVIAILAILLVAGAAAVGGWWFVNQNPEWWSWAQDELSKAVDELGLQPEEEPEGLVACAACRSNSSVCAVTKMTGI